MYVYMYILNVFFSEVIYFFIEHSENIFDIPGGVMFSGIRGWWGLTTPARSTWVSGLTTTAWIHGAIEDRLWDLQVGTRKKKEVINTLLATAAVKEGVVSLGADSFDDPT